MTVTTIKTTDELLALRTFGGLIRIEGDLSIECDVPYPTGCYIAGLIVTGDFQGDGNMYCGGYFDCGGNFRCDGDFYCGRVFYCDGTFYCGGKLEYSSGLIFAGLICAGGIIAEEG